MPQSDHGEQKIDIGFHAGSRNGFEYGVSVIALVSKLELCHELVGNTRFMRQLAVL
jgi:hypothetical protein